MRGDAPAGGAAGGPESSDPRALPGPEDPFELVGVRFPAEPGDLEEMARCLVEEYALLGYPPDRILRFFDLPFYAGSYDLARSLGRETIERIVADSFAGEG